MRKVQRNILKMTRRQKKPREEEWRQRWDMKGETVRRRAGDRRGGERTGREGKESVEFEFFTHNVKLLITALEHQHGESGPADCDLGSTTLCSKLWLWHKKLCQKMKASFKVLDTFLFDDHVRVSVPWKEHDWAVPDIAKTSVSLSLCLSQTHTDRHAYWSWCATKSNRRSINMVSPGDKTWKDGDRKTSSIYRGKLQKQPQMEEHKPTPTTKHVLSSPRVWCLFHNNVKTWGKDGFISPV